MSNAQRQKAFRERYKLTRSHLDALREALTEACERAESTYLTDHLPDNPNEWIPILIKRLDGAKLVVFRKKRTRK